MGESWDRLVRADSFIVYRITTTNMEAWLGLAPKRRLEKPDQPPKKSRKGYDQARYAQKKAGPVKWDTKLQRGRPWLMINGEDAMCSCERAVKLSWQ